MSRPTTANGSSASFPSGPQGQLAYNGCLETGGQNCIVFAQPLYGPAGVAVSRDGNSVYVADSGGGIARFVASGPQGQLVYDGCLANDSYLGCTDLPGQPLSGVDGMAMSPDGRSVYVASVNSDSIAHFFVGGQGQLVYDGCLADNEAATGCIDLPGAPLDGAAGVAVSPDGRSVYVASVNSDSVAHFFASGQQGQLVYDGCLANDAAPGCIDLPGAPLDGAAGVAVSPDGGSVYVASNSSNSIAHFPRRANGQLRYDGCLANDDAPGCANLPGAPLDGARGVAVSPDGRSVYVTSGSSHSIAHFFRALGDAPPPGSVATPGSRPGRQGGQNGFGPKTLVTLKLAAKRIPARGPLRIVVTNANAFTVSGRLSGKTAKRVAAKPRKRRLKLKSKTFRVAAKRKTTVRLRLPAKLRRLLKRNGKLKLRLRANLRDPAGNARAVTKTLTPRLKRKRKRAG
jgi:DNA-binding beta-propeller fold protein YncE